MSRTSYLNQWHQLNMTLVRQDGPILSMRQMGVMLTVYLEGGDHTIRSLAKHLKVTKAAVSRATDSLSGLGFIKRLPDARDKRSILLGRTPKGITYLSTFADVVASVAVLKQA